MVLIRIFIFACAFIVLGCSPSSQSHGPRIVEGTSDSGGGNGIENKAYEAYIVRPEQLPAFKVLIEPGIQKLTAISPNSHLVYPILKRWLLYKTWYVAPVELKTISKDVIGVSFSKDQTEQLALQTKKSVWINSDRFQKMQLQDQATLILHEMIMSLYYLKFKSWNDICVEKIYPDIQCNDRDNDILNELFPGSAPKPFDSDDYENIRAVTGKLLEDFRFASTKEVDDFLIQNKFDRRFTFGLGLDGPTTEQKIIFGFSEQISVEELTQVLSTAKLLNQLPNQCQGLRYSQLFDCDFTFEKAQKTSTSGIKFPVMLLKTDSRVAGTPLSFAAFQSLVDPINGTSVQYVQQKKKISYFTFHSDPSPTPLIVGTAFRSVVLVTLQDLELSNPPHTFLGLLTIPGVVTGKNRDNPNECVYAKPSASSIFDDVILVFSKHLASFDRGLLRTRAASMAPFTSCRAW